MKETNLIMNSQWAPGPNGGPMHFSGALTTYDECCICGHRTCSISIPACSGLAGSDCYDIPINVWNRRAITWGYEIRAIEAESIILAADFYGRAGNLMLSSREELAPCVGCHFQRIEHTFAIPRNACLVKLSMHFTGTTTACTFYAPKAYYA